MVYLITYDLHQAGRDYPKIRNLISSNGGINPMGSIWLVDTDASLAGWRDALQEASDSNDEHLIVRLTKDQWASYNFDSTAVDWLSSSSRNW